MLGSPPSMPKLWVAYVGAALVALPVANAAGITPAATRPVASRTRAERLFRRMPVRFDAPAPTPACACEPGRVKLALATLAATAVALSGCGGSNGATAGPGSPAAVAPQPSASPEVAPSMGAAAT